jgi:hypothetical protein
MTTTRATITRATITAALTLAACLIASPAHAESTFSLISLDATVTGNTVTATAEVAPDPATTLDRFGVCVRSTTNANLDYPQIVNVPASTTDPATFTATETFPDGTYIYFACLYENGLWYNVGVPKTFTTPGTASGGSAPAAGKTLAFADDFDTLDIGPGQTWAWRTSSYEFGDHNPNWYKRDWITPSAMTAADGTLTITATRKDTFYWCTGLLTTEDTMGVGGNGFRVRAGDFLVNHVMLPTGNTGSWPGLWTWDGAGGELDVFEWHDDNPNLLEFTNHVRSGSNYYTNPTLAAPGEWVWIGTQLGISNDTWYVGDTLDDMQPVYSDGTGIGDAQPFIIANLSLNNSTWHSEPVGDAPITYRLDTVRVYR